jgi:multiple sugar transport system ATP-binding protein
MGRAIVRKPVAFLLDEPLSNLDARLRIQMRTEIARLQKRLGTTTIYVTHDQTEAMTLGDRVAVLKHGVIQQIGTPFELYEQPGNIFVAGFIGSPAMNFLPAQIKGGRLILPLLNLETPLPENVNLPQGINNLIAGIRPEHFHVVSEDINRDHQHAVIETKADVVEWLGADLLVYFQLEITQWPDIPALTRDLNIQKSQGDKLDCVAQLDASHPIKEGDTIKLAFDPNKLHLFDPDSGERLTTLQ